MRELFVDTCADKDEEGRVHSFDYYILIDQMEVSGGLACESYGVKITETGSGEGEAVPNITVSISRIDELIERCRRNLVTPISLKDVVTDWLS